MKKNILIVLSLISITLSAQVDEKVKSLRYQSALVRGSAQVQKFQKALAQLNRAKSNYLKEKFAAKKDEKKFSILAKKIAEVEKFMLENYGMYSDITYTVVRDKASVSLLLTDDQLEKLSGEKKEKGADKAKVKRTRYPVFKLESAEAVQNFMADSRKGNLIRKKITDLKEARQGKDLTEQKKIAGQLVDFEESLVKYNAAMKKTYKIHSNLDYILDATALSIYMVITSEDLKNIGQQNKLKYEEIIKNKLKKK